MILGPKKLLELVKKVKLVENLSERELTNPEGAGFDLRLGEVYRIFGDAFLGETHRKTADIELVEKYVEGETRSITLKSGDFYLVTTVEIVNTPLDITINFKPRSTTFRSGLFLRTGNVAPGYKGKLSFGLKNEGPISVTIEMGARFVHAQFEEVLGEGAPYRGQWQGGRVTAKVKEKQV
jgi:deoxycytidine triphosphate deaminase